MIRILLMSPKVSHLLICLALTHWFQLNAQQKSAQRIWSGHLTPLTELSTEKYKDQEGGLYGNGENIPPENHLQAALREANKIEPLDQSGTPSSDGKIVILSIGMSNTTMEFSRFKQLAEADPKKASSVVVIDGAKGARTGTAWALDGLEYLPSGEEKRLLQVLSAAGRNAEKGFGDTWTTVEKRLADGGVHAQQVQALWIKQAEAKPASLGEFPAHARTLQKNLEAILIIAKQHYPNLRIAYLSSRIYAGYATTPLNPEPYAYEGAFAIRWLIEDQIAGKPELNYDSIVGPVKSPLLLWGPYLWADGETPRKADGLVYTIQDLSEKDGTHPADSARAKVANLLLNFLKTDPTARSWFVAE